jgi:hypothetical protein
MGQSGPDRAQKKDPEYRASGSGRTAADEGKQDDPAKDEDQEAEDGTGKEDKRGTGEGAKQKTHSPNR